MANYLIRVTNKFTDKETGESVYPSELFKTDSQERAKKIIELRLGTFAGVEHPDKKGKRILIHQKLCYKIGGIETANLAIAKAFKDRNITFVFGDADLKQVLELSKYHNVIIDDGRSNYECDVAIFTNYDSAPAIMDRVKARKIYQQIHADFYALKQMDEWKNFVWKPNNRVNRILAVSETAKKGLQNAFQLDSVVVPNILAKDDSEPPMRFISLTRATPEKGIDRLVDLLKRFDDENRNYILFLCATIDQSSDYNQRYLSENPRVITVQPTIYSKELLRASDMLIQLSYNESYCYSVREALQLGVPCLVSDIPELEKLITDGKNGYIYHDDMNLDKLFGRSLRAKMKPYEETVSPLWEKVLNGEL